MEKEKILLVEGPNDREVIYRIENAYSLRDICFVKVAGSVDNAKKTFDLYINENASKVNVLGLVLDADQSTTNRWNSIRNMLLATGNYDIPIMLPQEGLLLSPPNENCPKVGVWIMPNNKTEGMLEDFLLTLTNSNDPLLEFVDITLDELKHRGLQRFADVHKSKARAHTYLSLQEEPGCTLATAIEKNYFDSNSELVVAFAEWMKRLFT